MWVEQDSNNLSKLLKTAPLIAKLSSMRPDGTGDNIEREALASRERRGYEKCIGDIIMLSELKQPEPPKSAFIENLDQFENRPPVEQEA